MAQINYYDKENKLVGGHVVVSVPEYKQGITEEYRGKEYEFVYDRTTNNERYIKFIEK